MAELDEGVREIDICICSLIVILRRKPVIFEVCVCEVCIQIERVKKKNGLTDSSRSLLKKIFIYIYNIYNLNSLNLCGERVLV